MPEVARQAQILILAGDDLELAVISAQRRSQWMHNFAVTSQHYVEDAKFGKPIMILSCVSPTQGVSQVDIMVVTPIPLFAELRFPESHDAHDICNDFRELVTDA